jgi:hypothetical protein
MIQGCATAPKPYDYSAYLANMPRSILVLPPTNESTEVMAPYVYLSTVTRPLAERGYYVFPVAVIDAMMKENGVPSPDEMAMVSLDKIKEVINPDAVLYMTVVEWGTKYQVLDSVTVVHMRGRLVDTDTGIVLWEGDHTVRKSSSSNQNGLIEMLVSALINQMMSSFIDPSRDVACMTNNQLFYNQQMGLLVGERNNTYEMDQQQHRAFQNQAISESTTP